MAPNAEVWNSTAFTLLQTGSHGATDVWIVSVLVVEIKIFIETYELPTKVDFLFYFLYLHAIDLCVFAIASCNENIIQLNRRMLNIDK